MIYNNAYIDELLKDCEEAERNLKRYQKYGDCGQRSSAMEDRLKKAYQHAREAYLEAYYECDGIW